MFTIFISTYSIKLSIAILKDGKTLIKKERLSNNSHSINLIPLITEVLNDVNIKVKDLNEVIVVNGPGSFTGVRLGITVAKTLAYTLNIKIKTITSIDALAISDNSLERKTYAIKDNKGIYYGIYENNKLINNLKYIQNNEIDNLDNIIYSDNLDTNKIYKYLENVNSINPHIVKAEYIKKIEALDGN